MSCRVGTNCRRELMPKRLRFLIKLPSTQPLSQTSSLLGPVVPKEGFVRATSQNGCFADLFWSRRICSRILSPDFSHFSGKKCPENSSRKIPSEILQNLYNKICRGTCPRLGLNMVNWCLEALLIAPPPGRPFSMHVWPSLRELSLSLQGRIWCTRGCHGLGAMIVAVVMMTTRRTAMTEVVCTTLRRVTFTLTMICMTSITMQPSLYHDASLLVYPLVDAMYTQPSLSWYDSHPYPDAGNSLSLRSCFDMALTMTGVVSGSTLLYGRKCNRDALTTHALRCDEGVQNVMVSVCLSACRSVRPCLLNSIFSPCLGPFPLLCGRLGWELSRGEQGKFTWGTFFKYRGYIYMYIYI